MGHGKIRNGSDVRWVRISREIKEVINVTVFGSVSRNSLDKKQKNETEQQKCNSVSKIRLTV